MNKKRKTILYLIVVTIITILISIITYKLVKNPQTYVDTISAHHLPTIISYVLISTIQTIIPIIPGEPVELLAGYLFGKINGTIICLIRESMGSIIIILLTRKYGKRIINYIIENKKIKSIEKLKSKKAFNLFSILFIIPGTPKDLLCYFSGLAEYDLIPTLIITTIGRIPSIVSSTITAGYFQDEKYITSIIIYLITILVCVIDIYIYKKIIKNKDANQKL